MSLNFYSKLFMCFLGLAFASKCFSEGRCPPGQYPIGGQGMEGCAPISGAANAPLPAKPEVKSVPVGEWQTRWGAVANDGVDAIGVSAGQISQEQAEGEALQRCMRNSKAKSCKRAFLYSNQCMAIAGPVLSHNNGGGMMAYQVGPDENSAAAAAKRSCSSTNGAACDVLYSGCSEPFLKMYD